MIRKFRPTCLAVAAAITLSPSVFAYSPWYRIADTSTPIPGGTGTFTSFDPPVANRGALPYDPIAVIFHGRGSSNQDGIYGFGADYLNQFGGGTYLTKTVDNATSPGTQFFSPTFGFGTRAWVTQSASGSTSARPRRR